MEPLLVGEQTAEKLKQLGAEEVYVGIGSCYTEKREIVFSYQQALYCSDKGKIEKQNVVEYSRELWKGICLGIRWKWKKNYRLLQKTVIQSR